MYMGAWTLAQALANGLASVAGGFTHDIVLAVSASESIAYAAVFFIEAAGLIAPLALLQRLSVAKFRQEALQSSATRYQSD